MKATLLTDSMRMLVWKAISVAFAAFTAVLLARWLGPEVRGELALILLTLSLATLMFQFGLPEASIYILGADSQSGIATEAGILLIGFVVALTFFVLAAITTALLSPPDVRLWLVVSLSGGVSIFITFVRHVFLARKRFHIYIANVMTENIVYLGGIITLETLGMLELSTVIFSYGLSLTIALLASTLWLNLDLNGLYVGKTNLGTLLGACLAKGKHFFMVGLGGFATQRLNYFLLEYFLGVKSVGLFAAASTLPSLIGMIPNQVATVAYSYVARAKDGETPLQVIKPILQLLVAILVIAIGCFAVFANEIVSFIFGSEFAEIANTVVILSVAAGLSGVGGICVNALSGRGLPQTGTYMTMISIPSTLALGMILIPSYGLSGAALSLLGTSLITLCFVGFVIVRISSDDPQMPLSKE